MKTKVFISFVLLCFALFSSGCDTNKITSDTGADVETGSFNIYYNADGVEGEPPVDNNTYEPGDQATILDQGTLNKPGYQLLGWNIEPDGSSALYYPGDKINFTLTDLQLYAQWIEKSSLDSNSEHDYYHSNNNDYYYYDDNNDDYSWVDYNNDGNYGYFDDNSNYASDQDSNDLNDDDSNDGYDNDDDSNDGSDSDNANDSDESSDSDTSSSDVDRFSLHYHGNGNSVGVPPADSNVYQNGQIAVIMGPFDMSKPGYYFAGWNTRVDGYGDFYSEGEQVTIDSENIVLYALWYPDSGD